MKYLFYLLLLLSLAGGMVSCASGPDGEDGEEISDSEDFDDDDDEDIADEDDEDDEDGDEDFDDEDEDVADDEDDEDFGDDEGDDDEFADEDEDLGDEGDDEFADEDEDFGDDEGDEFADEDEDFGDEGDDEFADEEGEDDFADEEGDDFADEDGDGEFSDDPLGEEEGDQAAAEEDPFGEDAAAEGAGDQFPEEASTNEVAEQPDDSLGGFDENPEAPIPPSAPPVQVTDISFQGQNQGGTVVITTTGQAEFRTRTNGGTNQFVVEVLNAELPKKLTRPLITKDFPSNIASINSYQSPTSAIARVVIQLRDATEPIVNQQGGQILISAGEQTNQTVASSQEFQQEEVIPEPAPPPQQAPQEESFEPSIDYKAAQGQSALLKNRTLDEFLASNEKFYGRKISIEIPEQDVKDVLNFISEQSGLNMVISNSVEGKISLKLRDIPWDQALVLVLRSQRLGYERQGNVLRVAPLDQLRSEAQDARSVAQARKELQPLVVKVVTLSYAKVKDIEPQIKPFLTPTKGKVTVDERTNAVLINDIPDNVGRIVKVISALDVPPPQVLIQGKIVEAQDNFAKDLGINWGFSGSPVDIGGGGDLSLTPSLSVTPSGSSIGAGGIGFDLNIGTLDLIGDLNARLGIFERESKIKIISSPRITTLSNVEAEIKQTTGVPIITRSIVDGNQLFAVTFQEVKVSLKVTPQVTADESVMLSVNIVREFAGQVVDQETQARPINSREANTKVLVKNGQTAVIGGIFQSDATETDQGVPGLRHFPLLGRFFRGKTTLKDKNELLIFLTPRIIAGPISSTSRGG